MVPQLEVLLPALGSRWAGGPRSPRGALGPPARTHSSGDSWHSWAEGTLDFFISLLFRELAYFLRKGVSALCVFFFVGKV